MITVLHWGEGSLGTPKSDNVICARPLILFHLHILQILLWFNFPVEEGTKCTCWSFFLFHFTLLHLTNGEQNKFLDSDNWNSGMFGALPNRPKHALSVRSFLNPERSKVGQQTSKASSLSLLLSCIFPRLLTPLSFVPQLRLAGHLVMLLLAFAYIVIVIVIVCLCLQLAVCSLHCLLRQRPHTSLSPVMCTCGCWSFYHWGCTSIALWPYVYSHILP